ncbi:LytR cell envelope-related transcriptional attenuator [Modestobacter sp. DSM 44400]|nr:LytR cell envelope-related transcriptional attenuator [Modestobacter sp. DSM 44400]
MPALIVLLVLALAALGVWWNVLRQDREINQAQAAACTSASEAPPSLASENVTLRVYNAGAKSGAAGEVAAELQARGFVVDEVANDPRPEFQVTGVGEVRFGPAGRETAQYVALLLPGATDRADTRATGLVDLVLGPEFEQLATPEDVAAALAPAASAGAAC